MHLARKDLIAPLYLLHNLGRFQLLLLSQVPNLLQCDHMSKQSNIHIKVDLDEHLVPEKIMWQATDSPEPGTNSAKAMMLSFWDAAEKAALKIDLWTKSMMVDEMAEYMFQTFMIMADTYGNATKYTEDAESIRVFAKEFMKKFQERQKQETKNS